MAELFGYSISDRLKQKSNNVVSPIPPNSDDSTTPIAGNYYGLTLNLNDNSKDEQSLILRYRDLAVDPTVDAALDDIINEAIATDLDKVPLNINLSNLKISDNLKAVIREEFKYITKLLNFEQKGHSIFRRWLVDGKLFYHKLIDIKSPKNGIQELRYIDPLKIKLVTQKIKSNQQNTVFTQNEFLDYYLYSENGFYTSGNKVQQAYNGTKKQVIKFTKDAICYVPSGLVHYTKNINLSILHKAIKPLNQLRMLEDSIIIYALTRASEKRLFYIDVGNLPKQKAEEYLNTVMNRYKNKMVYDSTTGEIKDRRHMMTMLEDYWLPRRDSSRGTEISTLPAGQSLGDLNNNIEYFEKKLYQALNVPPSRQGSDSGTFNIGRGSEITRDEIKFTKFVGRLRKQFSILFLDILKTQLLLKNIITMDDWELIQQDIQIDYIYDNHYAEIKDDELLRNRLDLATGAEQYLGKYFSVKYIREKILRQNDEQIEEIDLQIQSEIQLGILPNPIDMVDVANQTQQQ